MKGKNLFNKIATINVFSKDPKELIRFYRDTLGLIPYENQNEDSSWFGFNTEGVEFAIEPEANIQKFDEQLDISRPNRDVLIQFRADSMEELIEMSEYLESKGVILIAKAKKRSYGYVTNFFDSDGNFLEIHLAN